MKTQHRTMTKQSVPLFLTISLLVAASLACGLGATPAPASTSTATPTSMSMAAPTSTSTAAPTTLPASTPIGGGGQSLLFLDDKGDIYTIKLFEGEKTPKLFLHAGIGIKPIFPSPDRNQIAYIEDGQIGMIKMDTTKQIIYTPPCGDVTDIAWSQDGKHIAFYLGPDVTSYANYASSPLCDNEGVNIIDVDGGNLRHLLSVGRAAGNNELVPSAPIALSSDGARIAVAFEPQV